MSADTMLWRQLVRLTREKTGLPLQIQLRAAVVQAVLDHRLAPGSVLPSSRRMADILGVSRNTVSLAYDTLAQEGFIEAQRRTKPIVHPNALRTAAGAAAVAPRAGPRRTDWSTRLLHRPSRMIHNAKPADWQRYPYPFVYGQPDPSLFPVAEWREAAQLAQHMTAIRDWVGDLVDADDPLLIEQIQQRVLPRRGIWVSPEQILVTLGAQHALYLIGALLLDRATVVGVERPGYPDIRNVCRQFGAQPIGLPLDAGGLVPTDRVAQCDIVFVQPSHQNPTTVTMPMARRRELLAMASRHDVLLVEDDYDSELTFEGEANPALHGLDPEDRVIYVGSLSKTLAPGLRLGYLVAAADFIAEARAMRRLMLRHPPANNQRTVALFLKLGHHDNAIRRLVAAYRGRAACMADALRRHLPEAAFTPPAGGSALWARGPAGLSMDRVARDAAAEGLLLDPGSVFFDQTPPPREFLRLGYSSIPRERIEPGIALLARLCRATP